MPQVSFSPRDLMRGIVVTPAWYRVKINSVGEAPAKDQTKGPSTNYPIEGTILFEGDTGDTKFAGVPLDWNFNSKAMSFSIGFLQSLGVKVEANTRYELAAAENGELDVFVENGTWNNRLKNEVNHKYRAPKPEVKPLA